VGCHHATSRKTARLELRLRISARSLVIPRTFVRRKTKFSTHSRSEIAGYHLAAPIWPVCCSRATRRARQRSTSARRPVRQLRQSLPDPDRRPYPTGPTANTHCAHPFAAYRCSKPGTARYAMPSEVLGRCSRSTFSVPANNPSGWPGRYPPRCAARPSVLLRLSPFAFPPRRTAELLGGTHEPFAQPWDVSLPLRAGDFVVPAFASKRCKHRKVLHHRRLERDQGRMPP
jgi:hypothetical protein